MRNLHRIGYGLMTLLLALPATGIAEETNSGYLIHDMERAEAPVVTPGQNGGAPSDAIVLFDGVCLLCNGFVHFVIDHEKKVVSLLLFAPDSAL